jgi:hypothetical protein
MLMKLDMRQASHEGRKTVTRRLSGLEEINLEPERWELMSFPELYEFQFKNILTKDIKIIKPRYHVGQVVFIREAHYAYGYWALSTDGYWALSTEGRCVFIRDDRSPVYFPDNLPADTRVLRGHKGVTGWDGAIGWYKRSPLFLPAKCARDFPQILDVRAERLQDITEEDAVKEGMLINDFFPLNTARIAGLTTVDYFAQRWDSINPKHPWASNPWLFRYEYKLVPSWLFRNEYKLVPRPDKE